MTKDGTGSRMGIRSKRYAAIIEHGKIVSMNVDEKGMVNSSAEKILEQLKQIPSDHMIFISGYAETNSTQSWYLVFTGVVTACRLLMLLIWLCGQGRKLEMQ